MNIHVLLSINDAVKSYPNLSRDNERQYIL